MYISQTMFITGMAYEAIKRDAIARGTVICDRLGSRLTAFMDEYDRKHYQTTECTGDILCERSGRRHKDGCIGRTEPFSIYVNGLKEIN